MLPSFSDYYLIEAVDLDRTWDTHKDKIISRALEGRHTFVPDGHHFQMGGAAASSIPTGGRPWDAQAEKEARELIHHNVANHAQYFSKDKDWEVKDRLAAHSVPLKVTTTYNDTHLAAATLRQAVANDQAAASMKKQGVATTHAEFAAQDHARAKQVFMDIVKAAAPHPKYIPTITKMYANGGIKKIEDISTQAAEAFGKYHKLSTHGRLKATKKVALNGFGKLMSIDSTAPGNEHMDNHAANHGDRKPIPETDFKRFDNLADVRAVTDHHDHTKFLASESKAAAKGSYTVVHDDDDVTVYHPHTWEASKALAVCPHTGQKAAWCTAADSNHGQQYFQSYKTMGALLIYHPKKPLHDGEMYQTHHASEQYMDEHDDEVEYNHHSTANRTNDLGVVTHQFRKYPESESGYKDTSADPKARFPGFNSKSALNYTYKHMYEHPEQHEPGAAKHYDRDDIGVMGVQHGRVLKHTFENHFNAQNPHNSDSGHWRPITPDEAKASREEAERKGKQYFPANTTVKDHAAFDAALAHHQKVREHYFKGDWYHMADDDEEDY